MSLLLVVLVVPLLQPPLSHKSPKSQVKRKDQEANVQCYRRTVTTEEALSAILTPSREEFDNYKAGGCEFPHAGHIKV
jgi:hypothetical protein